MAKQKPNPRKRKMATAADVPDAPDRHKNKKLVRLADELHAQLGKYADDNDSIISRVVRRFVIDGLKAKGYWPPPTPE